MSTTNTTKTVSSADRRKPSTVKDNDRLSNSDEQGEVVEIKLNDITVDQKYQIRENELDEAIVDEYRAIYKELPDVMEPIVCVRIDDILYLVAGFQRHEAAKRAGCETIRARMIDGDEKTAFREALSSNKHGLQLSSGDKKKAILIAVENFPDLYNTDIAKMIGCSESYVRKVKNENTEDDPDRTSATLADDDEDVQADSVEEEDPDEPSPDDDDDEEEEDDSDDGESRKEMRPEVLYIYVLEIMKSYSDDEKAWFYNMMYESMTENGYSPENDEPSDPEPEEHGIDGADDTA